MCVVNDSNPRRRHRAAYLAPARAQLEIGNNVGMREIVFPLAVDMEVMQQRQQQQQQNLHNEYPEVDNYSFPKMLFTLYFSLVDCLLLLMVLVMSFFLYDVEITIVKSSSQQGIPPPPLIRRHHTDVLGSRILWRNYVEDDDNNNDDDVRGLRIPSPPTSATTTTIRIPTTRRGFQESVV
ncbi:hypothetical protein MHU86_57 [Fragilaria crotonensis]|nr:hypothetical protein MHU86_57 [Fragilaria crotonensis]